MGNHRSKLTEGMTLIEVLASVVILSIFITVMLTLVNQFFVESKLNLENQQATTLGQNMLAQMSVSGAASVIQQGVQRPAPIQGVQYTVTPIQLPTPAWASSGSVYAEVVVSWSTIQAGRTVTKEVEFRQLFDQ